MYPFTVKFSFSVAQDAWFMTTGTHDFRCRCLEGCSSKCSVISVQNLNKVSWLKTTTDSSIRDGCLNHFQLHGIQEVVHLNPPFLIMQWGIKSWAFQHNLCTKTIYAHTHGCQTVWILLTIVAENLCTHSNKHAQRH